MYHREWAKSEIQRCKNPGAYSLQLTLTTHLVTTGTTGPVIKKEKEKRRGGEKKKKRTGRSTQPYGMSISCRDTQALPSSSASTEHPPQPPTLAPQGKATSRLCPTPAPKLAYAGSGPFDGSLPRVCGLGGKSKTCLSPDWLGCNVRRRVRDGPGYLPYST